MTSLRGTFRAIDKVFPNYSIGTLVTQVHSNSYSFAKVYETAHGPPIWCVYVLRR